MAHQAIPSSVSDSFGVAKFVLFALAIVLAFIGIRRWRSRSRGTVEKSVV